MLIKSLYIGVLFFFSLLIAETSNSFDVQMGRDAIVKKALELRLYDKVEWIKLVHYKKNILGNDYSEVAGKNFFISEEGSSDPKKELTATIEAFLNFNNVDNNHPICRFPARLLWLKKELNKFFPLLDTITSQNCPLYQSYLLRLNAKSVSYVFSSYYLSSPGSSFGHTLFRINKKPEDSDASENELLDYGIGYAADVTTHNPFLYVVFGLFGGFKGVFTNVPYYYKIREYNDYEARDLWSYDLGLTQDEVHLLIAHIWEVGGSYFNYFFLTKNCAYHLLTVLEAAAPRLNLVDKLPFYVIPSESIKVFFTIPNLVRRVSYRPSMRSRFFYEYNLLDSEEKSDLMLLLKKQSTDIKFSKNSLTSQAKILDAAIDYWALTHPNEQIDSQIQPSTIKQDFLIKRSETHIVLPEQKIDYQQEEAPHLGHGARRCTIGIGNGSTYGLFSKFEMRFALHDLLDPQTGYPPNSEIEFAKMKIRAPWGKHVLTLDEATFFRVGNFVPLRDFQNMASWKIDVGLKKVWDFNCNECLIGGLTGGGGVSFSPIFLGGDGKFLLYALVGGQLGFSPNLLGSHFRIGIGPMTGFVISPFSFIHIGSNIDYFYLPLAAFHWSYAWSNEIRIHLSKTITMNFLYQKYSAEEQTSLGLMYYF